MTDNVLTSGYDIAAYMDHIGNSMPHLILALSHTA
uniref:Uncharacterized protein n=1 Tax=Anguilla anguilla TaxID=7936 RepID=A0A0E9SG14_ANGAN